MRSLIFTNFDVQIQELYELESLINAIKEVCLDKEFRNIDYNLPNNERLKLSNERNNYINLLSIALYKIQSLQNVIYKIEDGLNQL